MVDASNSAYNLMLETAGYMTKNCKTVDPNFLNISFSVLTHFSICKDSDIFNAALNLMISTIISKQTDLNSYTEYSFQLFNDK